MPGPEVFSCNGGGANPNPNPTTTLVTTTRAPTTAPTTSSPPSCTVAKWGQCGGVGYTGCTTCEAGSTCNANNEYYHQCV